MQYARAIQTEVTVDYTDQFIVQKVLLKGNKASGCMFYVFDNANIDSKIYYAYMRNIKAMTANTKKRYVNYWEYQYALNGQVWRLLDGDTCDD